MVHALNGGGLTSDGCPNNNRETCQGNAYNNTPWEETLKGTSGRKQHASQDSELPCPQVPALKQVQMQEDLQGTEVDSASYISGDSVGDSLDMGPRESAIPQQSNDDVLLQDRPSSVHVSHPSKSSPVCHGSTGDLCIASNNFNTDESFPIDPSEVSPNQSTHSGPSQNLDEEVRTTSVTTATSDWWLQLLLTPVTPVQQAENDICADSEQDPDFSSCDKDFLRRTPDNRITLKRKK